jgi:hypothetical protein
LKDTRLVIKPAGGFVRRGHPATLVCEYDLEGAPLYSVKWYRGSREFFRHMPNETPPTKIFPFQGLNLDVSIVLPFYLGSSRLQCCLIIIAANFDFLLYASTSPVLRKRFLKRPSKKEKDATAALCSGSACLIRANIEFS